MSELGGSRAGLHVDRNLVIPEAELEFRFTPSGGPGGQHANRSSTRVEVLWNVEASTVLNDRQRASIRRKLRHRIDSSGTIRVASDAHRSQLRNREEAVTRLRAMLTDALRQERKRVATKPTRSAKEKRLQSKRRRSEIKKLRRGPLGD